MLCDWWVARWSAYRLHGFDNKSYTLVYFGLAVVFMILLFLRNAAFTWSMVQASTLLHNAMFGKVLRAPMTFFWCVGNCMNG